VPLTQKQLADYAGVSPATVCLALKDDPRVAVTTRERIRDLAGRLGYVPNHVGRALRGQRSLLVGYLVPSVTASFYNELIQGIGEVVEAEGYGLVVSVTGESPEREQDRISLLRQKRVDGLIVSHCHRASMPAFTRLVEGGTPVVFCDFECFEDGFPQVRVDDRRATRLAAQHLLDLGHRRLAYCFWVNENSLNRYRACAEAMTERGLAGPALCADAAELGNLLSADERPTAVVCYSDEHAVQVRHAAAERGLDVPDDLSVVGFDDMPYADWPELSLTTIAQPRKEIGRTAARVLLECVAGQPGRDAFLDPSLTVRGSTAPPP
jgi:DNA-binding LacI/PurR family transcriptional regulator